MTRRSLCAALLSAALLVGSAPLGATTVVPVTVTELTRASDEVLVGTVRATTSRWHQGFIVTDCEVVVDASLKGATPLRATIWVRVAGGVVGRVAQHIPDAPMPVAGASYVFFLAGGEGRVRYLAHLTASVLPLVVDRGGRVVVEPAPGLVGGLGALSSTTPASRVPMDDLARAVRVDGAP